MNAYKKEKVDKLVENYHKGNLGVTLGYFALAAATVLGAYVVQNPVQWLPFFMIMIFAANHFRNVGKQNLYGPLNIALYNDCDPETYHAAYRALTEQERIPLFRQFNILCVANGIYYMADFDGAIGYLKNNLKVARCNPSQLMSYYTILANCYSAKGDIPQLKLLQIEVARHSISSNIKRNQRRAVEACQEIIGLHLAFLEGDYATARAACEVQLEQASYPFQKIGVHYRLGLIDRAEGHFESARSHLDYVSINGGGMYFSGFARQERLRLDEYIHAHPEMDPRKSTMFPPTISETLGSGETPS